MQVEAENINNIDSEVPLKSVLRLMFNNHRLEFEEKDVFNYYKN